MSSKHDKSLSSNSFDVVVIGAGVVGCAVTRRLTLEGGKVLLLEKAREVLDGASKANSAILHTGFDAPVGSLEHKCIVDGHREYRAIRQHFNLPLIESSALVLAWSDAEEVRLPELMDQARQNGVSDVELLGKEEILRREPHLSPAVRGGFVVPRESLIDPWSAPHAYLLQALAEGAQCCRDCEVLSGEFDGTMWTLQTSQGSVRTRAVVNCGGLFGDEVDRRLTGTSPFTIRPRKGQFVVFDKAASRLASAILLPVPTAKTKGIVVCRTAFGNLLVGPTAEDQDNRVVADVQEDTLQALIKRGEEILPDLKGMPITATYAGLRPASEKKEYRVSVQAERHYVTVGGIRSTGLSAALGLATHVKELLDGIGNNDVSSPSVTSGWTPHQAPFCPSMPNISESDSAGPRGWAKPDNGGIVCHCEWVTRKEIDAALSGPLPAHSLAGLKRRTRVTMGRCQGFYCMGTLSKLTAAHFAPEDRLTEPCDGSTEAAEASPAATSNREITS